MGYKLSTQTQHKGVYLYLAGAIYWTNIGYSKHLNQHWIYCILREIKVLSLQDVFKLLYWNKTNLIYILSLKEWLQFEVVYIHLAHVAVLQELHVVNLARVFFI